MAPDLKEFELNRIANMLKSLGWSMVSTKIEGDKVIVTYEKVVKEEGR